MGGPGPLHRPPERQELHQPEHVPAVGGGLEQRALGDLLHERGDLPGPHRGRPRLAGPIRVDHQGRGLPADGDRRDGARDHLELRLRPGPEYRPAQRDPRPLHRAWDLVAGQPVTRQRGAHHCGHLGVGRLRHRDPVGGAQEHPERGPRGRADRRRERAADLLPRHPADGQPADLGPRGDAAGQRHQVVRPDLRAHQWRPRNGEPRDRVHDVPGGAPGRSVRPRRRDRGDHADPAHPDHGVQRPALP